MQASVRTQPGGDVSTVAVAGAVDLSTAHLLHHEIQVALDLPGVRTVLVDLAEVDFLDSSGIAVLIRGRRLADERGIEYRVSGASGIVLQVLTLTGVWEHLSGEATA